MELRGFLPEDFDEIRGWIGSRRAHALWCAGRFRFPLEREDFLRVLADAAEKTGETPFTATIGGKAAGFFCCSLREETKEGKLRFVLLDPALRGKGLGRELVGLALHQAFALGAERVLLSVFPENKAAKQCYEAVGFREIAAEEGVFPFGDETWGRCRMAIGKPEL